MFRTCIALFVIAVVLSAQSGDKTQDGRAQEAMKGFAVDSYKALSSGDRNLIFSPLSIAAVLSMGLEGARGQTATEMAKVLHQTHPAVDKAGIASLVEQITNAAKTAGDVLLNANGLWVQRGFPVQPDFKKTIQDVYRAPFTLLDFKQTPDQARAEINAWTDKNTRGKIHELFGPGSLSASTRLVLTSAIYFNGTWQSPFRPEAAHPAPFKLSNGSSVQASFMNQHATAGYAETSSLQILEMKYGDGSLAFDVLLPKPGGLADMERSLNPQNLTAWLATLKSVKVEISIPKFRSDAEFSLRETLSHMGMPAAFDAAAADFSGIDGRRDLMLSDVVHKAFVDVSEQGTEAAAATGGSFSATSMVLTPPIVFRADHPFAFMIRDTRTGVILFAGRLMNPSH